VPIEHDGGVEERYQPADVVVKRDEAVEVRFADGHEARFPIMDLRLGCPCATCRSLRDRGQDTWPLPTSPTPLRLTDAALHGAWGLHLTWNDGHATGIYPFEALRRWSEGGPAYGADSGLPGGRHPEPGATGP
jgi:DUF971 family protein